MNDDTAVREMLHDLMLGQPEAPVDRFVRVRRRYIRRRIAMTSGAAMAAAIAVAGTILVAGALTANRVTPADRGSGSWQLPWPTRYGGVSSTAAAATQTAAVGYYERFHGNTLRDPRSLYVGTPSGIAVQWVVLEADHQLIALASPDNGLSWTPYVSAAPPPNTKAIGFDWRSGNEGNKVFVLAPPGTQTVDVGYIVAGNGVPFGGWKPVVNGVGVLRVPRRTLPGDLFVAGVNSRSTSPAIFPEGTSGIGHIRPWQKALDTVPKDGRELTFLAGAGAGDEMRVRVPRNGTITMSIACMGPAPARLTVVDGTKQIEASQAQCNGTDGLLDGQVNLPVRRGDHLQITAWTNGLTLFAAAVYLVY